MYKKKDLLIILILVVLISAAVAFWIYNRQWFTVGNTKAQIDNACRTIFVSLPEGSSTRQKISFNFPFKNDSVYIKKLASGEDTYNNPAEEKLNSGATYNFKSFISHCKIVVKSEESILEYDLWVTTGAVPILTIEVESDISNEPKVDCSINIFSPVKSYNTAGAASEIELIDISPDIPKDSYSLNIKENPITGDIPSILDFESSKRFELSASYLDRSFLREKLAYDIFKALSDDNVAPDSRYVEVYLNGSYQGVYLLSRRVDRNMFSMANFSKDDKDHSVIYEASGWRADFSRGTEGFSQTEPDYQNDGPYLAPLEELIEFITRTEKDEFLSRVDEVIDMNNLIDNHILFLLSGSSNELASNQYIYRGNENEAKFKFCPGSHYISGFGRNEDSFKVDSTDAFYGTRLYNRLYENETYREKLKERWNALREDIITVDNIYSLIDRNALLLLEAQDRNFKKWPITLDIYGDNSIFSQDIDYIKEFVRERIKWLDDYINYPPLLKIGDTYAMINEEANTIFCALPQGSDTSQKISWYFSPDTNVYIEPVSLGNFVVPKNDYSNYEKMITNGKNTDEITIFVDKPSKDEIMEGDTFIHGWALNTKIKENTGVEHIILFDGPTKNINTFLGEAKITPREDVSEYFNNDAYLNAGFELSIDTTYLESGSHSIYIYAFDKQGNYSLKKIDIVVNNTTYKQKNYEISKIDSGQKYDFNELIFQGILTIKNENSEKKYDFYLTNCDIPLVIINTNNIDIPDSFKISATMKIIYNDSDEKNFINGTVFDYYENIGIELRGYTSLEFSPKKPYSIEIRDENDEDKNVSILGMPKESDWVLIAPYSDKSLMRDVLAFELSNQIELYAPRTKFVEVFLDGIEGQTTQLGYRGVYVFAERVKRNKNRVDVEKLDSDDDNLISGGYILEMSSLSGINPEETYFKTGRGTTLIIKYPRSSKITDKQKAWITNYINEFEYVLYSDNFRDAEKGYRKYIDVDSFIDYTIISELFKNRDFLWKSTFIYKEISGKLKLGPIWDFNLTAGNIGEESILNGPTEWRHTKPVWTERLFQDEYFVKKFIERWKELRQDVLSDENIYALIDSNVDLLSEAQIRNFEKWKIWGIYVYPNEGPYSESYEEEIEKLKDWFSDRTTWINQNIDSLLDST